MLRLSRDAVLVCAAGGLRAASVSLAGVLIAIHLSTRGFSTSAIGLVIGVGMTASAVGTVVTGLYADSWGRRRTLALLGVLTALGYLALAFIDTLPALLIVAAATMVNGMGRDRGAASALEQALLPSTATDARRTWTMAWYNAAIDIGHALGAGAAILPTVFANVFQTGDAHAATFMLCGAALAIAAVPYAFLNAQVEQTHEGASWSEYTHELNLYQKELDDVSGRLRKEEMRRLATRIERWVRSRLDESVGLEFNKLGSGRGGSGAPEHGDRPASEKDLWDRVWVIFTDTVSSAEKRFTDRATSFDASADEVEVGLWRLRRKSWGVLRAKIDEEVMEGNILLKLRENFEDKFRYDESGVPRIWRPTDDIEGIYTKARESTITVIPLLARFKLSETSSPPPLDAWIGEAPASVSPADEDDLAPIGGVDDDEGKSLEEEMTVLSDTKQADLLVRFKKTADGVYVEAKRSAIGGMTQVPLYFYGLLLALGWNEIVTVLRNPVYFIFLILAGIGAYITWTLNLWGPMARMANAASAQALDISKERLRDFLESSESGRQAMAMGDRSNNTRQESVRMDRLNGSGKRSQEDEDLDDI